MELLCYKLQIQYHMWIYIFAILQYHMWVYFVIFSKLFMNSQEGKSMEVKSSEFIAMPTVNWGHVADLLHPVSRSLAKVMNYIKDNYQFKVHVHVILISC